MHGSYDALAFLLHTHTHTNTNTQSALPSLAATTDAHGRTVMHLLAALASVAEEEDEEEGGPYFALLRRLVMEEVAAGSVAALGVADADGRVPVGMAVKVS